MFKDFEGCCNFSFVDSAEVKSRSKSSPFGISNGCIHFSFIILEKGFQSRSNMDWSVDTCFFERKARVCLKTFI